MKLCQTHWDMLRTAIADRGLMHLVSKDGHALMDKMSSELKGDPSKDNYDPLMAANLAIWSNALDYGGLYLMSGDYCPLCEAVKNYAFQAQRDSTELAPQGKAEWWIDHAADEQLARARELGLAPPIQ